MSDDVVEQSEEPVPKAVGEPIAVAVTRSDRELWWEVVAVLAVGVIPHLMNAFVIAIHGPGDKLPYWLDALHLAVTSASVIVVVLYLMSRSQEPWSAFGIVRLRFRDVWLGLVILLVHDVLWNYVRPRLPEDVFNAKDLFPLPRGPVDFVLMAVKYALSGFAEELVMRAYLITRLERLLKSRWLAVFVSAVLFASYHLYYGPGGSLIFVAITGLLYGGFYLLVRRLWPLALAHMLMNMFIDLTSA